MSIASNIIRIQNAKTAIKNAIEEKGGGPILDAELIDEYANKIINTLVSNLTFADCISRQGVTLDLSMLTNMTAIGNHAFFRNTSLVWIELPSTLLTIGPYAFANDTNLAITSLPNEITSISNDAFYNCTHLALTSLPSGLTTISNNMFAYCTDLALDSLPSGLTSIGTYALSYCPNITLASLPNGLTTLGAGAFTSCPQITLSSLPSGLTIIENSVFLNCPNINLSSLPSGITSIGTSAFGGCTKLTLTSLPDGLTSIGASAFSSCSSLQSLSIGSAITSIATTAFYGCTNLTSITVVDARGHACGVKQSSLTSYAWDHYGILKGLNEGGETVSEPSFLTIHCKGFAVEKLQTLLNNAGYNCGAVDGIFGPKTEGAVKQLQAAYHLPETGIVDEPAQRALKQAQTVLEPGVKILAQAVYAAIKDYL